MESESRSALRLECPLLTQSGRWSLAAVVCRWAKARRVVHLEEQRKSDFRTQRPTCYLEIIKQTNGSAGIEEN